MNSIPSLGAVVKTAQIPLIVQDKNLEDKNPGRTLSHEAQEQEHLSPDELEARGQYGPVPEAKVQEVLENGGFLSCNQSRSQRAAREGVDVYEYQRLSRDGGPLTGAEARRPPVYRLTAWGTLALSCTCPRARRTGATCKHILALTRELAGQHAPAKGGRS